MIKNKDWNPNQYLQFEKERTQPAWDLVNRINIETPGKIVDIGCGPGNSTSVLKNRWPESNILGVDSSEAMIAKAREKYPEGNWQIGDALNLGEEKFDIVFSNAVIHWIQNHDILFTRLLESTQKDGCIAIQMPLYHQMPVYNLVAEKFDNYNNKYDLDPARFFNFNDSDYYFDLLSNTVKKLDIWETSYIHIMDSVDAIFNMIETTGIKPYLDHLKTSEEKEYFSSIIKKELKSLYKAQKSGKVLFPFKRMFIVAIK